MLALVAHSGAGPKRAPIIAPGHSPHASRIAPPLGVAAALVLLGTASTCRAGVDHLVTYDDSGIWKRSNQEIVEYGLIAVAVGGALWEGGESHLGKTFWTSID